MAAQTRALRRRMTVRLPMSGRDLLIDVEGTPIPGGGAVLLLRDVGREEDERRRLSHFASFVAHELRNPLAVARARIELSQREAQIPERSTTHGARALESVEAAIAVLERLEMYSRAESGVVEAVNEPFEPRRAVSAAVERLRARGSDRSVKVRVRGLPPIEERHHLAAGHPGLRRGCSGTDAALFLRHKISRCVAHDTPRAAPKYRSRVDPPAMF